MKLKLYFDGSCEPKNPGGTARAAWRLLDETNQEIAKETHVVCSGPEATNNVAEWHGLLRGIRYVKANHPDCELEIYGDSQLVICQVNQHWRCLKDHLRPMLTESLELLQGITWNASWISRKENKEADALSRST